MSLLCSMRLMFELQSKAKLKAELLLRDRRPCRCFFHVCAQSRQAQSLKVERKMQQGATATDRVTCTLE